MKTDTDTVEFTRWGHPGWNMDLLLEGGPDVTRAAAEKLAPFDELDALTFECGTMPRGEFEAVGDFSP